MEIINVITAAATLILILAASLTNASKIKRHSVDPALSTWVIIFFAATMSFITYLRAENKDVIAGVLNAADMLSTITIIIAIVIFGSSKWKLKSFEKFYFVGLVLIGIFWLLSRNDFQSNLLVQLLITFGYIPTAHNIIKNKVNKESFTVWGLILTASVVSLYPSINAWLQNGNILAVVYSGRSVILLAAMLILMAVYERRGKADTNQIKV